MTNRQFLTREQAADILQVSPRTIDRWIRKGRLKVLRTPGNGVRILPAEIERSLQNQEPTDAPPAAQSEAV